MRAGSSRKRPEPIKVSHGSDARCSTGKKDYRNPFVTSPGTRSCGSRLGYANWWRAQSQTRSGDGHRARINRLHLGDRTSVADQTHLKNEGTDWTCNLLTSRAYSQREGTRPPCFRLTATAHPRPLPDSAAAVGYSRC